MKRRSFLKHLGVIGSGSVLLKGLDAAHHASAEKFPDLAKHKIVKTEFKKVNYNFVRHVGKNARIGIHGQHKTHSTVTLHTDQGASGWGLCAPTVEQELESIEGKSVTELIDPSTGTLPGVSKNFDLALHDICGVIMNKPVYEFLGKPGEKAHPIYSGMIYFDELEPEDNPAGFDKVMENCAWDVDYGYRQLKVKVGRSGRWYPHDEGLAADIEIVNRINETFKDQGVQLLVDANDMYSLQDTKDFLAGTKDVDLFWMEEPFNEANEQDTRALHAWMHANGLGRVHYADGEFRPNVDYCLGLARDEVLDVMLHDVFGFGFTNWRHQMPKIKQTRAECSPHAWGSRLKTHYSAHMATGMGNCCTLEGVTCESEDIDFGDYPIKDGKLHVSEAPGFGMKLLV